VFIAVDHIGYVVAIPLVTIGPGIIASIIAVYYFGEISGKRNICILTISIIIGIGGMVMNSLSLVL
jgi:hypothetical protein